MVGKRRLGGGGEGDKAHESNICSTGNLYSIWQAWYG